MSYTIKTTSGSTIAVVQDATLNTIATSLTLVGRDYAGYGAFLNENFVYILENFASDQKNTNNDSTSGPENPITGQLWYDTTVYTLKVYDSTRGWKPISSSIAAQTAPAAVSSTVGDLWFDTTNNQLYVFAGSPTGWILIGPPTTTVGSLSGAVVETITDSSANDHVVIKFYIENNIVAIMSYDSAYTPQTTLAGFSIINPGFNLVSSDTLASSQLTGDASNALYLNGVSSGQFLRNDQNSSSAYQLTLGGGLIIGTDLNVKTVTANNEVRIDNLTNQRDTNFYANVDGSTNRTRLLKLNASTGSVDFANVTVSQLGDIVSNASLTVGTTSYFNSTATFNSTLLPSAPGTINIGSNTSPFIGAWAQTFYGNLVGNVTASSITVGNVSIGIDSVTLSGNSFASQSYVTTYVQTSGRNSQGVRTISTAAPSGGSDGDIWYQV